MFYIPVEYETHFLWALIFLRNIVSLMTQTDTQERKTCFELRAALEQEFLTQADLARMCGVKPVQVWRWCEGKAEVPTYVWSLLSAIAGMPVFALKDGEVSKWKVERRHVYRYGKTYKGLAKRFHPDATGRDTTAEMQLINGMRHGA